MSERGGGGERGREREERGRERRERKREKAAANACGLSSVTVHLVFGDRVFNSYFTPYM